VKLVVYAGGHFEVSLSRGRDLALSTLAWYDKHLGMTSRASAEVKEGGGRRSPVCVQLYGGRAGDMIDLQAWPPPGGTVRALYLHAVAGAGGGAARLGTLRAAPPTTEEACALRYVYDPRTPTPYAGGGWLNFRKDGPRPQRRIERRRDVLVFTSEALRESADLVGVVRATLHMRCSAPECDVLARLCVVRAPRGLGLLSPDCLSALGGGTSLNLCEAIERVDFKENRVAGVGTGPRRVDLRLGGIGCRVHAGDRVRLQVCSAAHPRAMRHPLQAPGEDWLGEGSLGSPATLELVSDAEHPSCVQLPVLDVELARWTSVGRLGRGDVLETEGGGLRTWVRDSIDRRSTGYSGAERGSGGLSA